MAVSISATGITNFEGYKSYKTLAQFNCTTACHFPSNNQSLVTCQFRIFFLFVTWLKDNNNYLTWTISGGEEEKYPLSPPPLIQEHLPYLLWKLLHNLIRLSFPNHHCLRKKIISIHNPHFLWHQMWTQCSLVSLSTSLLRTLFITRKYAALSQSTCEYGNITLPLKHTFLNLYISAPENCIVCLFKRLGWFLHSSQW